MTISRLYPDASRAKAHCAVAGSACVAVAVCGFAVRLGTSWKTEGSTFCHNRGTEYQGDVQEAQVGSGQPR